MKEVVKKTPGGRLVIHRRKGKVGFARCANCKKPLLGVPALRPSKLSKLSKTKKRPNRPYGGYLCSNCMRIEIKRKVRG